MKCPHCGKVPYPAKNQDGTWNWKNLLRVDWMTVLFVVVVLFMAWSYHHDIAACEDIIANPNKYCDNYCDTRDMNQMITDNDYNIIPPIELEDE